MDVSSAISPLLDCQCVSSLYSGKILVHGVPTGTTTISAAFTSERHSSVNFENLSQKWNIGLETAKRTLQVTMQQGIWTAVLHPLHRCYQVHQLHLNRRQLNGDWFTDTLFSKVTSIQGTSNTCAQVFTNGSFTSTPYVYTYSTTILGVLVPGTPSRRVLVQYHMRRFTGVLE